MSVVEETLAIADERPGELLAIVGPTATGKTALAVSVAERIGGEVISADSVQIYRGFDVGSGKPTATEQARAPHHLVSVLDPAEHVDAAAWAGLAAAAITDVRARGRVPILCGGTFLWTRALLFGLAEIPAASAELREQYRMTAEAAGRSALHERLRAVDRPSADRLHPNDFVRVSRALEVFELTGRPLSDWHREHAFARARHRARLVAIAVEPGILTDRIRARVRGWLERGWIEEVQALLRSGYADTRAMGSVGYTQVRAMIEGRGTREDLELAIVRATRVFARRQRTWLNHVDVAWVGQSSSGT
ncbi:MAG TPA: tRNA (adenosine(37)-N6)-dimethylallyltransferase MiaA [Polyangiaceae bacterium]